MNVGRIFLVGFMCSGKTTVGELLAKRLGWRFVDIDKEIEKREGMSIPDIFERKGEAYFREIELRTLRELSERERVVISTGGGLGANPEAMKLMKERGVVVWLKVSFEDFMKRCGNDEGRPLLKLGEKKLRRLLEERNRIYSEAHIKVEGKNPSEIVGRIVSEISQP